MVNIRDKLCVNCREVMKEYDRYNREKRKGRKGETFDYDPKNYNPKPIGMKQETFDKLSEIKFDDEDLIDG